MTDGALEKHLPVIERIDNGYLVKIGEIEHPMVEEHYIEWIEIITKDKTYRKFLHPNEKPEAFFKDIDDEYTNAVFTAAKKVTKMINNALLIIMDSQLGHLCFNELENITYELKAFMSHFEV